MTSDVHILIIDDDIKIADLLKIHFLSMGGVYCRAVQTAAEAYEALERETFHVIVSDLHMPDIDGLELLSDLNEQYPEMIKILFTGFGDLNSFQLELKKSGVSNFISKPWQQAQLRIVLDIVINDLEKREALEEVVNELELVRDEATFYREKLNKNILGVITVLREMQQRSSTRLSNHCRRTAIIATNLSRRLGLGHAVVERVEWAALVHDMVLSTKPDHLQGCIETYLSKTDKVNYRTHAEDGGALLRKIDGLEAVADIVQFHHENVDGSGFYGIKGEDLPIEAKLLRICDCYDEEKNFNKNAHRDTLDYMKVYSGRWFDKSYFDEFYIMMQALKR